MAAPGDQESIELSHNGIDIPHRNTIEAEVTEIDDLDSMNEHRESTILAASTNHQQRQQRKAGVTVVTVDPDNEDEEPDGINGVNEAAQVHRAAVPEKLTDEDKFAEIWYERWFFKIFPQLKRVEDRRRLRANDPDHNRQFGYKANKVVTSKYNIITFLPLNLLEQFLRVANTYFLVLVILQSIPSVSAVPPYSTVVPLIVVLAITAIKDAYDDIKRHISDWKLNHRIAHVLNPITERLEDVMWQSVRVGSILRLEKDDFVTADMLLLSSSEPNSLIYIETAELDGETNLKVREPLTVTAELEDDLEKLSQFRGEVECEPPNNRLHKFIGNLIMRNEEQSTDTGKLYPLNNDKILLRGCRLRNTKWMYGLVIYAGHDSKLVQNTGRTIFKRTRLDNLMNKMVILILGFLLFCGLLCFIGSLAFEFVYGQPFTIYADYFSSAQDSPEELAFLQIISNIIVLNTFVPISLYVSVEIIRLGQSLLINWDRKMYYEPEDVPAIATTTTLNEELGQIEYIFSDKTGTLTQNVMTFLKCSIGGVKYGNVTQKEASQDSSSSKDSQCIDFTKLNPSADPEFLFYDRELVRRCQSRDPACDEFFTLLSVCHTVLPSMETGTLEYNAQSPDEAALVAAAKNFGYVFKARTPFTLTVDMLNKGEDSEQNIEILNILDFNNERKRMSVIVRVNGKITLYCKGADSVVFARLNKESQPLKKTTMAHLTDYAREGLRTLVLAKRQLMVEEYAAWAEEYQRATVLQVNRDQALDNIYEKIEKNLTLMGATAIEDKLQDGVPEAIANFAKANIKIWVLTGDKQETAINIGYSCKLLTEDMRVFIIDESTPEGVKRQLEEYGETMDSCEYNKKMRERENGSRLLEESNESEDDLMDESKLGPPFGIVINGHSLIYGLKDDMKLQLLETASRCKAVICCRVTPLQKQRVVDLVKKNKAAVTLAIGDGANDVGMIKAAHIGVGISGREGRQAVLASDFSFGQFKHLERLLLVHGQWSYHRMTSFLRYFFYKNFAFTFSQFIFAFFCGFTAQTLYDPDFISVYNVIYTSLPVIALAILDQNVDEKNCCRHPKLYFAGQQNKNFNPLVFVRSLVKGIYVAFVLFFVLFGLTFLNLFPDGYEWDYQSFGVAASGALILIVNLQIAMDTYHWNPIMHLFVWGSILSWLVVIPIASTEIFYLIPGLFRYVGVAFEVLSSATFWIYLPIATIVALAPTIIFRIMRIDLDPHIVDDVRLLQDKRGRKLFKRIKLRHKHEGTKSRPHSVRRSGYAYSHTEGFGDLISSGRIFGLNEEEVLAKHRRRLSTIISNPTSRAGTPPSFVIKVTPAHEIIQVREASVKKDNTNSMAAEEIHEEDGEREEVTDRDESNQGGSTPPSEEFTSNSAASLITKIDECSSDEFEASNRIEGKTVPMGKDFPETQTKKRS